MEPKDFETVEAGKLKAGDKIALAWKFDNTKVYLVKAVMEHDVFLLEGHDGKSYPTALHAQKKVLKLLI